MQCSLETCSAHVIEEPFDRERGDVDSDHRPSCGDERHDQRCPPGADDDDVVADGGESQHGGQARFGVLLEPRRRPRVAVAPDVVPVHARRGRVGHGFDRTYRRRPRVDRFPPGDGSELFIGGRFHCPDRHWYQ